MITREETSIHVNEQIDCFLSGRLDSEAETAFEAHLLSCDACFAAYVLRTVADI